MICEKSSLKSWIRLIRKIFPLENNLLAIQYIDIYCNYTYMHVAILYPCESYTAIF